MTHLAQTVTPRVSSALFREIPRFFGGFPAALQEFLQNSLRAGATEIDFHVDGQRLTVTDNGRGLDDPQIILTAAESGWGSEIVEPAGLGALSALNPEFATRVTYRSRAWQFSLTPEAFARGESVPVETAEFITGFQITLELKSQMNLQHVLREKRGYAPATVRLNAQVVPPRIPEGEHLETTVGTLYLERSRYSRVFRGIWEHFPLDAPVLQRRIEKLGSHVAAAFVQSCEMTLIIDPASGLRPKLPDRNALMENAALDHAALVISERLTEHANAQLRAALPELGADVLLEAKLAAAARLFGTTVLAAFLKSEGYVGTTLSSPKTVEAYISPDGESDTSNGWTDDWIKPDLGVVFAPDEGEQSVLALLRTQGYAVPYGTPDVARDRAARIEAHGIQTFRPLTPYGYDERVMLGLAPTLMVEGVNVPVYVHVPTSPESEDQGYFLVLGGPPEAAEQYLRAHQAELGGLLLLALLDTSDLREAEFVEDDETVYAQDLGDLILSEFIRTFFPERAQAQQEVSRLNRVLDALTTATGALAGVDKLVPALATENAPHLVRLRAEHSETQAQIHRLTLQHRLS